MAPQLAVFHGDTFEGLALVDAAERYCACETEPESGVRTSVCPMHQALVGDQRFLDGLVFMRRRATQLLVEEHGIDGALVPRG